MKLKKLGLLFILIGAVSSISLIIIIEDKNEFFLDLVICALMSMVVFNSGIMLLFFRTSYPARKKISGILFVIGLSILFISWVLKNRHLPGAGIALIEGILFLCFAYMPLLVRNRYEKWQQFMDLTWHLKFLCIGDLISIILLLTGTLSKIQHWPGGDTMIISGGISLAFTVFGWNQIFKQVVQKRKEAEDKLAIAFLELNKKHETIEAKQKEILDSIHYAKRIQQALLPNEKYIDRVFKKN
jgi:hypothetical protein